MTDNKKTITKYIEGFNTTNHELILSCLTDDIEWIIPGMFKASGKEAFDKHIENDEFLGSPTITLTKMIEENDVVAVEGQVKQDRRDGGELNVFFCDIFVMEKAKVKQLTSYLTVVK